MKRLKGDWLSWARNVSVQCAPVGLIWVYYKNKKFLYVKSDQTRFFENHGHEPICINTTTGETRCWPGLRALKCKPIWIDEDAS